MTPERMVRIEEAKKHPNETDCRYAQNAFREMFERIDGLMVCKSRKDDRTLKRKSRKDIGVCS